MLTGVPGGDRPLSDQGESDPQPWCSGSSSLNPQPFSFHADANDVTFHTTVRFERDVHLLGTQHIHNADKSEWLPLMSPHENIQPGMAIGWHFGKDKSISKTTTGAQAFGVVSSCLAIVMNSPRGGGDEPSQPGHPVIFDKGQEDRCVTKGPVRKGQGLFIVFGDDDGALVAADSMDPTKGIQVGMAKESLAPCLYYFVMSIMFTSRVT
jgi:hypothetical protein